MCSGVKASGEWERPIAVTFRAALSAIGRSRISYGDRSEVRKVSERRETR